MAAYAFLAFHLLDHSDLPYINISEDQIWSLRAQVFDAAGLGDSVIVDDPAARRVGSARTAQEQTARAIFADLDLAVAKIKVGRSYSLPNLIEHHNRYAKRVGMFLHFVSGARASATTEFLASAWPDSSPFGFLDDKSVGIAQSRTPIPISPAARAQLKLWQRHITSLQDRLSEPVLVIPATHPMAQRYIQVQARQPSTTITIARVSSSQYFRRACSQGSQAIFNG